MLGYANFYDIAKYGNENWKGSFMPREVACNAYDYLCEYRYSVAKGKPTHTMIELCKLICEDMGYQEDTLTVDTVERMKQMLSDFIMEI